jgi:cell division protein FtsI (penicillin-binding protein 3)
MIEPEFKWIRFRLFWVFGLCGLLFVLILSRAVQLQLWQGNKLARIAKSEIEKTIPRSHKRGVISDRNRFELAMTIEMESIFAQPKEIKNIQEVSGHLGPLLSLDRKRLAGLLNPSKPFVFLKRRATPDECEAIRAQGVEGIAFVKEAQRFYPYMDLASHVLGFVGTDPNGLEGLERQYNSYLKSPYLYEPSIRDALGRALYLNGMESIQENEGLSLVLTIDKNIQYLAEKELKKGVLKTQAKGGMAIVLDPKTGEILALANYPSYNLNAFQNAPTASRRNQAITDTFEPGSTFKTFLMAAALEEKKFTINDMIFCENGAYRVANHIIHDVHPHGWLSFQDVLKVSSNIGAAKIGKKLGAKTFYSYIKNFGFGKETGLDLPGEVNGLVWPHHRWGEVMASNISFGQGISVTGIQLASALGAIANEGRLMKPFVVKQILDQKGHPVKQFSPHSVRQVLSPETAQQMCALLGRVTEPGGTALQAAIDGVQVGGKTGTAQKVAPETKHYAAGKYVATFMGFVPVESPALVILVVVDEPKGVHYGGVVSAPIFKGIAENTLSIIGIRRPAQIGPHPTPQEKPDMTPWIMVQKAKEEERALAADLKNKRIMPDVRGMSMRKVVELLKEYEMPVDLLGSGKAVSQHPLPGTVLSQKTRCQIQFQPVL